MSNDNSNERTQWGEYDVAELGRLMLLSSQCVAAMAADDDGMEG